jgi:hypothetical protein
MGEFHVIHLRFRPSPAALLYEFEAELARRAIPPPGSCEICFVFGDLMWPSSGSDSLSRAEEAPDFSRFEEDPAFTLTAYSRWMALARINGEIRFYAAPLPKEAPAIGKDPARRAAAEAEPPGFDLAIFGTVSDAVSFAVAYLGGAPLGTIEVARIKRSRSRDESRQR